MIIISILQIRKSNIKVPCPASHILPRAAHIQIVKVLFLPHSLNFLLKFHVFPNSCSLSNALMVFTASSFPQYSIVFPVPVVPSFVFFAQVQDPSKGLFSGFPFLPLRVIVRAQPWEQ